MTATPLAAKATRTWFKSADQETGTPWTRSLIVPPSRAVMDPIAQVLKTSMPFDERAITPVIATAVMATICTTAEIAVDSAPLPPGKG